MEFSRKDWNGLPFSPSGDLPIQGSNLHLLHYRRILYHWALDCCQSTFYHVFYFVSEIITSTDWWVSLVAQTARNLPAMQEIRVPSLSWEDPLWSTEWLHPLVFLGFPGGASSKDPTCECRRQEMLVQSLGWEDLLEKGMAYSLQCSCLENPVDRGAWWATAHTAGKSRTRLKWLSRHECTDR